jgi:hypothetical protein
MMTTDERIPANRERMPLGHFTLPEGTIEHDLAIQERYQAFSAELLRISLLGLSVVGLATSKVLFPEQGGGRIELGYPVMLLVMVALFGFGLSAAAALIHRYSSVDSVSWHIQSLRRDLRNDPGDSAVAEGERRMRHRQFNRSRNALRVSASGLGVAASALALALILGLFQPSF